MRQPATRWIVGAVVALALAFSLALGGGHAPVAHGEGPTPTPTQGTNSDPGGSGGDPGWRQHQQCVTATADCALQVDQFRRSQVEVIRPQDSQASSL